jgi:peptidyl-prolyl cis-trans isomerase B (cyclophilin B)
MLLALVVVACGDDDSDDGGSGDDSATTTETQAQTETPAEEKPARKRNGCTEVAQPEPKREGGEEKPTEALSGGDYEVTFETNCGSFTVEIDEELGGLTAASFVQLAESGFYEGTFFHRIVPGFVIQGGDPTGSGFGGPGYTTEDAPPKDAQYPVGTVAMAKAGAEPPGTAGSQFFVVTATQAPLPPDDAVVGRVTAGKDVVTRIGELGDPATEMPTQPVVIEDMVVEVG